jgi:4-hydroxybenzoate polyprenyltransferase
LTRREIIYAKARTATPFYYFICGAMKKILLSAIDLFFLTRPVVVVPVWGFCAFGVYAGGSGRIFAHLEPSQYLLILLYSLSPACVYVLNQIADYEVDARNGGFPLLVRGDIPRPAAWACAAACGAASIIGPLLMGRAQVSALSLIAIVLGYVYSFKPFSLSGRPFCDFLTNALEAALAFSAGWAIAGGEASTGKLCLSAAPYFLLMCAGAISSTLPDIDGDRECGKITTAVRFGPVTAHRMALAALITAIPASVFPSVDLLALACAAAAVPTYIPYIIKPKKEYMELTYKVGGAATMAAASLALPLLLPAGLSVFAATKIYFKKRHGVSYPSLNQDSPYYRVNTDKT